MKVRCDKCSHTLDIPDSEIATYFRVKGGRASGKKCTPAQIAARKANLEKARKYRHKKKEQEHGNGPLTDGIKESPPKVKDRKVKKRGRDKGWIRGCRPRQDKKQRAGMFLRGTIDEVDLALAKVTNRLGPYRDHRLWEGDGRKICKELDMAQYHNGVAQMMYEAARKSCRAKSEERAQYFLRIIQKHLNREGWPRGWTARIERVDLPPKEVLPRYPWITDRAVVIEGQGKSIMLYCCEWR